MSDTPTPEATQLPEPTTVTHSLTFRFPHVLLGIGVDAQGFVSKQIREGESRQVDFTSVTTYADEPVKEQPFAIRGENRLQFGGLPVMVINDAVALPGLSLPATEPTASEYLALVGKDVLIAFLCRRDIPASARRGRPTYRIDRTTIKLQ